MEQLRGQIVVFYLFDVAEAIDLDAATEAIGGSVRATLAPKPATPAYVRYQQAPLLFDGAIVSSPLIEGFHVTFKVFDYGVISLRLARAFEGTWRDLADASDQLVENEALELKAEQACRAVAHRLTHAVTDPRQTALTEDYLVFAISDLSRPHTADEIVEHHGDVIASVLFARRAGAAQPAGTGRGAATPHLLPRERPRHPDVECGLHIRY